MAAEALPDTKRVDVIDRRECPVGISIKHTDSADALSPDNASESFENTCLGLVAIRVRLQKLRPSRLIKKRNIWGIRAVVWKSLAPI